MTLSSTDTPPFGLGWHPRPDTNYRTMTWVVHRMLMAGVQASLDRALGTVGARRSPVFLTDWPVLADRILQLTVPRMEYPRSDLPSSVAFAGPLPPAPPQHHSNDGWWRLLSEERRKIVHVTQGTWDNQDLSELIHPTIHALADHEDLYVVATTGRREHAFLSTRIPANAYVTDYLPYAQLLPHVDVMITNGGYGGVHQALSHGIPLIVAGRSSDKPEVAARVAYVGAGIDLGTARPTGEAIVDSVRRLLNNEDYGEAARVLGREIHSCNPFDIIADELASLPPRT